MFDYTRPSKTLLVELINDENGLAIQEQAVWFTAATAIEGEKNSQILVRSEPGQGYTGTKMVSYDRVDVAGFVGTVDMTFLIESRTKIKDLIPSINQTLNIALTVTDLALPEDDLPTLPISAHASAPVVVGMGVNSLVYIGELDVVITRGELSLTDIVATTELDGFFIDESQIVDGKPHISTLFASNVLPGF